MSLKIKIILAGTFFTIFVICCLLIVFVHSSLTDAFSVSIVLGAITISAIAFPILTISAVRNYLERGPRSRLANLLIKVLKLKQ
jgi:hypothetical protein